MLANSRGIDLRSIPTDPLPPTQTTPFPDKELSTFLFPSSPYSAHGVQSLDAGTSGGYLYHLLTSEQRRIPGTQLHIQRGRNADVVEYILAQPDGTPVLKAARYYGFRNIQNLVRKLKPAKPSRLLAANRARAPQASSGAVGRRPAKTAAGSNTSLSDYAYIEVMACPGGCTNGGGQIRLEDAQAATKKRLPDGEAEQAEEQKSANPTSAEIRAWLGKVEEAYRSADPGISTEAPEEPLSTDDVLKHWSETTDVPLSKLVYTTYHHVESDVGKNTKEGGETARVVELAGKIGGGW
ncbi:Cytosolic Fe-S cluster assembly factor nar1 [Ascosphaera atra]|nr:Cytosolic Fe-S cluster assembly factor nar1 [Ascosphaera atra]